ncbi:MAG: aminoacyl-histidine dipeptidase [Bacteroidota bacterium]
MSQAVRELEPQSLWNHFSDLNAIPRASKKEERVIAFMQDFGKELGLETLTDEVGNVIIRKPATPGMENRIPIVMQSHLDMVHQKNNDTNFDFDSEGIKMIVKDDWVKAEGTTLGADNGIGVASIMAILKSSDIPHPAIDALFTIDEETGMTGALGLKGGLLNGKILLNLDTEDDDELTIGCAGGRDVTASGKYSPQNCPSNSRSFKLTVSGLNGGHSGMDIHKGLGNANKIMNRLLWSGMENSKIQVAEVDGGGLRNAIPRESVAVFVCNEDECSGMEKMIMRLANQIKAEHKSTDAELMIKLEKADTSESVLPFAFQKQLLGAIYSCPNGIYRMSPEIDDLVQTSNNVARVIIKEGTYTIMCLTRSSVDTEKDDIGAAISGAFASLNAEIEYAGEYPGWAPKPDAAIVKTMADIYEKRFNEKPHVMACHAGLECGILGTNYPEMEMISFGPNIRGAHSPDEKCQISSVQKYWGFLLETLENIPLAD